MVLRLCGLKLLFGSIVLVDSAEAGYYFILFCFVDKVVEALFKLFVGVLVGVFVGVMVGVLVGVLVGVFVGVMVGVFVGVLVGVLVGCCWQP